MEAGSSQRPEQTNNFNLDSLLPGEFNTTMAAAINASRVSAGQRLPGLSATCTSSLPCLPGLVMSGQGKWRGPCPAVKLLHIRIAFP